MRKIAVRAVVFLIMMSAIFCGGLAYCKDKPEWTLKRYAVQTFYKAGTPHTDRSGKYLDAYNKRSSFFPIVMYHASYTDRGNGITGLADLVSAGFNTAYLCWGDDPVVGEPIARKTGMQLVVQYPLNDQIRALKDSPTLLAWYLNEEPAMNLGTPKIAEEFEYFQRRYKEIKAIDPNHPVLAVDGAWTIGSPEGREWWIKWNTAGDVSCHDNYPIRPDDAKTLSSSVGIPESVSLAVSANQQKKPVWLCVQAHCYLDPTWPCSQPTVAQQRCMVYAAIIHGATGIMYFGMDADTLRNGGCIGIAPDPKPVYAIQKKEAVSATPLQLQRSKDLWNQVVAINKQIALLRPSILSPTANMHYDVYTNANLPSVSTNPIRTLLKTDPSGGYNLLLANIDATEQHVKIRFPGSKITIKELFGSSRQVKRTKTDFELYCNGYDVRIFHISINK